MTQPNILLIHSHDLGDWLPSYGHPTAPAPHLTEFAESALLYESAFATSPLCTPARSSMFTGLMPHENGLMGLSHAGWSYADGVRTMPELLSEGGYDTALIGLQHEAIDPRTLGYDEILGLGFLPRALEVSALTSRWIEQRPRDGAPFLAVVGMWETHRPWPTYDYVPVDPASVTVPPWLEDTDETRDDIAGFYGSIRQMDEAVGHVLRALEASPFADNTLVIFTTDHGVAFPGGKSTLYDRGVKVALIVKPPASWAIPPGRVGGQVSHLDILPTLLECAGIPPTDLAGTPLIAARARAPEQDRTLVFEKTYHDRYDPIRAIRTSTAKYIRNFAEGPLLPLPADLEDSLTRTGMGDDHLAPRPDEELYVFADDPWELRNVASEPRHANLRRELQGALMDALSETHDPVLAGAIPAPPPPSR